MEWMKDDFIVTDSVKNIDLEFICQSLNSTYWAKERSKETIEKSIANSVFLSVFKDNRQIGFSRIVTDNSTFAWICDVYIDPSFRGEKLGVWLMKCTLEHPACRVKMNLLATKDAHGLYEKFGFGTKECMRRDGTNIVQVKKAGI
ncbi:MAG: GNAT family N-acetyltransferase [Candidatus Zixiibacteriota bacterium]